MKSDKFTNLPRHIAFIMDGNGRWATKRGLSRKFGHLAGVKALEKIISEVFALNIPYMTVFAFSTENWNRPKDEVDGLLDLLRTYFNDYFKKLSDSGIKINIIGDVSLFPADIGEMLEGVMSVHHDCVKGTINVALNYGGRDEIIRAVNIAVDKGEPIDEKSFADLLYTAGMPDPDLIIRTSGELRISNFLLYQSAYSELYFCKKTWPEFDKKQLHIALKSFSQRNRRYGKIK